MLTIANVAELDAGDFENLAASMITTAAGTFSETAVLDFESRNDFLSNEVVGSVNVLFEGTVNNLAVAAFE